MSNGWFLKIKSNGIEHHIPIDDGGNFPFGWNTTIKIGNSDFTSLIVDGKIICTRGKIFRRMWIWIREKYFSIRGYRWSADKK